MQYRERNRKLRATTRNFPGRRRPPATPILDARELASIARSYRQAETAARRIQSGLFIAAGLKAWRPWFTFISWLSPPGVGRKLPRQDRSRWPTSYDWTPGHMNTKRPLTRGEWATVARDASQLQSSLEAIGHAVRPLDEAEGDRFYHLARRVEGMRHELGKLAYRQHQDLDLANQLTAAV